MSNSPPGKKKSSLLRPFKNLLSRRSRSPSHQGAQSVTRHNAGSSISGTSAPQVNLQDTRSPYPQQGAQPVTRHNAGASISSTSTPQVNPQGTHSHSPQGAQSVTPHNASASIYSTSAPRVNPQGTHSHSPQGAQRVTPQNASASISASPTNSDTSTAQVSRQGTEYTAILELSNTPSGPLKWEHRMKEWGSTGYEGLKTALQGIYDCLGIFPPLQSAAGVLLMISKVVDVRGSMYTTGKYIINFSFCVPIREFRRTGRILNNLG